MTEKDRYQNSIVFPIGDPGKLATVVDSVLSDIAIEKGEKNAAFMRLMSKGYNYVVQESCYNI
ncbi:MAG: hypothetical protein K6G64_02215 [Eubacterium sp.]|nr:hypothetical protein [Eubacterium sp.]